MTQWERTISRASQFPGEDGSVLLMVEHQQVGAEGKPYVPLTVYCDKPEHKGSRELAVIKRGSGTWGCVSFAVGTAVALPRTGDGEVVVEQGSLRAIVQPKGAGGEQVDREASRTIKDHLQVQVTCPQCGDTSVRMELSERLRNDHGGVTAAGALHAAITVGGERGLRPRVPLSALAAAAGRGQPRIRPLLDAMAEETDSVHLLGFKAIVTLVAGGDAGTALVRTWGQAEPLFDGALPGGGDRLGAWWRSLREAGPVLVVVSVSAPAPTVESARAAGCTVAWMPGVELLAAQSQQGTAALTAEKFMDCALGHPGSIRLKG